MNPQKSITYIDCVKWIIVLGLYETIRATKIVHIKDVQRMNFLTCPSPRNSWGQHIWLSSINPALVTQSVSQLNGDLKPSIIVHCFFNHDLCCTDTHRRIGMRICQSFSMQFNPHFIMVLLQSFSSILIQSRNWGIHYKVSMWQRSYIMTLVFARLCTVDIHNMPTWLCELAHSYLVTPQQVLDLSANYFLLGSSLVILLLLIPFSIPIPWMLQARQGDSGLPHP